MAAISRQELADAVESRAGLEPDKAWKAVEATLDVLVKRQVIAILAKDIALFSVTAPHAIRDLSDRPTVVSSLSQMVSAAVGLPNHTVEAVVRIFAEAGDPLRATTMGRMLNAIRTILVHAPDEVLRNAAAAPSDIDSLLTTLEAPEAIAARSEDPLLDAARARGIEARNFLLAAEGGPWTAEQVAKHLRITRQGVDRRRRANKLLAITSGRRGYLYPSWQFSREGVLPGFEDVLQRLAKHDAWSRMIFFLTPDARTSRKAPIRALRERQLKQVLLAAEAYGEHGAI